MTDINFLEQVREEVKVEEGLASSNTNLYLSFFKSIETYFRKSYIYTSTHYFNNLNTHISCYEYNCLGQVIEIKLE